MSAIACLRVLLETMHPGDEALDALVTKLTSAFLESRWVWPRRHAPLGGTAFLLADPRATELNAKELQKLAAELQTKLFGVEGDGEVSLLVFEGGQEEIMKFATCEPQTLQDALSGADDSMFHGRIQRVTPLGVVPVRNTSTPADVIRAAVTATGPERPQRPPGGFHGLYHAGRQSFVGSIISDGNTGASSLRRVLSGGGFIMGEAAVDYDKSCLRLGLWIAGEPLAGALFFPLSFSSIVHRPTRERYVPLLSKLPRSLRGQFAATVYDVPRDPSFTAISQVKAFLNEYFAFIDLEVTDPGFQVEKLQAGFINSVSLILTGTDSQVRMNSVRRFMDQRESYQRRKIRPTVSHIRNRAELNYCLSQRVAFVSGPAVSELLEAPAGAELCPLSALPMRGALELDRQDAV